MSNIQTTLPIVAKSVGKSLALSLFEYIVAKLIGADQIPPKSIEECNNELREYSMTRYMKTLYFLCLTSCTILQEEEEDNQRDPKDTPPTRSLYQRSLFNSFSFTTYPNGPVAHDVYGTLRGELPMPGDMLFKVGRVLGLNGEDKLTDVRRSVEAFEGIYKSEADLAKRSLERLFGGEYTPLADREETGLPGIKYKEIDTQMLIDVSHSFPSWIAATQGIEEELYSLRGVRPVFDFINGKGIRGNISKLLKDEEHLQAELQAFNKFRRKIYQESN